ncbi:MAG: L,D-transpeptidase family protein [Chloroflexi bacterium]|nr:L,D-transpeptidase family protein [Chloroflexota bacterium]
MRDHLGLSIVAVLLALGAAAPALGAPTEAQVGVPAGQEPSVEQVARDGVPVYADPTKDSAVRLQADAGDVLRVTGQAPGIDGDTGTWVATTEGYVTPDVLQPANGPAAQSWTLPDPQLAPKGWWGEVKQEANVRAAAGPDAKVVGTLPAGTKVKVLAEEQGSAAAGSTTWYEIDGGRFAGGRVSSTLIDRIDQPAPNTTQPDPAPADGTWITVDRGAKTLTFVQRGQPVFATFVAIGKAGAETAAGRYEIVSKLRFDDMTSERNPDALNGYYLPNVPNVEYFKDDGSAIHGTYWHDDYGAQESQGCINLTLTDAAYLFGPTSPSVPDGEPSARSSGGSRPGQVVD